jgi:nucleolar protein 15
MSSSSGEDSVGMVSSSDSDISEDESSSKVKMNAKERRKQRRQEQQKQKKQEESDDSYGSDSSTGSAGNSSDFTSLLDKATAKVRETIREKKERKAAIASALARANKAKKGTPVKKSSVIYIGHVPHGFYEDQMRGFLSQFGTVTRLRLSRNKRTGRSKHYAFVEFEERAVAKIVAAAMNGYFLAGRRLVCHVIKKANVHEKMFNGSNRKFRPIPWRLIEKQRFNAPKNAEQQAKVVSGLLSKEKKKRKKLEELGIDYDFPGYSAAVKAAKGEAAETSSTTDATTDKRKNKKQKKTKKQ